MGRKRIEHKISKSGVELKWCGSCGQWLNITNFYKHKSTFDGLQCHCKQCSYQNNIKWISNNREKSRILSKQYQDEKRNEILELYETIDSDLVEQPMLTNPFPDKKRCSKCHKLCNVSRFYADKRHTDGLMSACKNCVNKINRDRGQYKSGLLSPLIRITEKRCNTCGLIKTANEFVACRSRTDGLMSICKECHAEKEFKRNLTNRYGIDIIIWNRMIKDQNNRCKICGNTFKNFRDIHVDHLHSNSQSNSSVRSLLCRNCNCMIGFANEDITILQSAIEYLQRFEYVSIST